jgi:hypothetical protein
MSRKALGGILLILGLVLVVAGVLLMGVIVPGMKQWPDDVDTVRTYEGTMPVLLNPNTFEFMKDLNVTLERHVKTEEVDGDVALVSEAASITGPNGEPLQARLNQYAIDRKTMLAVEDYPASWTGKDGFWNRVGLVLGWPIDSEQKDYDGWADDYRATVTLKYEGEEKHDRADIDTYLFTAGSEPRPIETAAVEAMGLPVALPKEQLIALIGQTDLPNLVKSQLPNLLEQWPDDNVPLAYYYEYEGKYWVEPKTGVLIDTWKHELRKVGLPEEMLANSPLAALPEEQREMLRVPVFDLTYQATDSSVEDAKQDAEDAQSQIELFGTTIPLAGIVLGALLALLGIVFLVRR